MKKIAVSSMVVVAAVLLPCGPTPMAQEATAPVVGPGGAGFDASVFRPHAAEYEQAGFKMLVEWVKSGSERPILSVLMTMPNPKYGQGTDQIGHYADDMSFAFRRFGMRGNVIHAEVLDGVLYYVTMPLPPAEGPGQTVKKPVEQPFFDGTLAYWMLAGLPLKVGYTARLPNWGPGQEGPQIFPTPPFRVTGKEKIKAKDGTEYDCWVVEASNSRFMLRNYVTREAPYLIKQVMVQSDGKEETVVELVRMFEE